MLQTLALFGGIGADRAALTDLGIAFKEIDYVEKDPKPVRSYNAMFEKYMHYNPQNVQGYNLKPDILIHGSPCQSFSIAGKQEGADENSGTESSLMWETIKIIRSMGEWRPRIVVWENVKNLLSKYMIHNFKRYMKEMERMGYKNSFRVLNAMEYGLPQNRDRVFVVSVLGNREFNFDYMQKKPMADINQFLEKSVEDDFYTVTQPSILRGIGKHGINRATIIKDYCYTITQRQDRCPAQVIALGNDKYRFLTEKECWRLQGYKDKYFLRASKVNSRRDLYKQAGNSIPVVFFKSMFTAMFEHDYV